MPPTPSSIQETILRYYVPAELAKGAALNELRNWEPRMIANILSKLSHPPCLPLARQEKDLEVNLLEFLSAKVGKSLWVKPPENLVRRSAAEGKALCVNSQGRWSLRESGYVSVSHVWIEGIQADEHDRGIRRRQFERIFKTVARAGIGIEWIWLDVLALPNPPGKGGMKPEKKKLKTAIINNLANIYSHADAVVVLDALLLRLPSVDPVDVMVGLICGRWMTRVWTYQEIKLATRAIIVTATGAIEFSALIQALRSLAQKDEARYDRMLLTVHRLERNDELGVSLPDIALACQFRTTGNDVDYARAFFPVLGLKWNADWNREEGMQQIYWSYKHHAARIVCMYGAPRLSISPGWAPAYFSGLQGMILGGLEYEIRGLRGDWYSTSIKRIAKTFVHEGQRVRVLDLEVEGAAASRCQILFSRNEAPDTLGLVTTAIDAGTAHIFSYSAPVKEARGVVAAPSVLLVEQVMGGERSDEPLFEGYVYCCGVMTSVDESVVSLGPHTWLLRHENPRGMGKLTANLRLALSGTDSE